MNTPLAMSEGPYEYFLLKVPVSNCQPGSSKSGADKSGAPDYVTPGFVALTQKTCIKDRVVGEIIPMTGAQLNAALENIEPGRRAGIRNIVAAPLVARAARIAQTDRQPTAAAVRKPKTETKAPKGGASGGAKPDQKVLSQAARVTRKAADDATHRMYAVINEIRMRYPNNPAVSNPKVRLDQTAEGWKSITADERNAISSATKTKDEAIARHRELVANEAQAAAKDNPQPQAKPAGEK